MRTDRLRHCFSTVALVAVCLAPWLAHGQTQSQADTAKSQGKGADANKSSGKEGEGSAKVWTYLESTYDSPETGGEAPTTASSGGKNFQSAQLLRSGGAVADGGLMTLSTDAVLESACANGKVKATFFCGRDRELAKKGCDAAAKIYGVPSLYMICKYAADSEGVTENNSGPNSTQKSQQLVNKSDTEARSKAESEHYKKAQKKYEKMMKPQNDGGKKSAETQADATVKDDGVCHYKARDARKVLNRLEDALSQKSFMIAGKPNCDFFRMIELLAIAEKHGEYAANRMIQTSGSAVEIQEPPEFKQYLKALMNCINKASGAVKAPDYEVGSCDEPQQ